MFSKNELWTSVDIFTHKLSVKTLRSKQTGKEVDIKTKEVLCQQKINV